MGDRLRIAIFTFGLCPGGTERQIVELCKGLDRNRFELSVLVARPGGELEAELERAGITIDAIPINSLREFNALRQLLRLRRFIRERKIDLLHTFSLLGNTFGVLAGQLAQVPVIVTSRRDMYGPDDYPPYGTLQAYFSRRVDGIVTNAESIREMLIAREYVEPERISVVHNGLDMARFATGNYRSEARRQWGINDNRPVIGVVADLKKIKGHIYLLKATRLLANLLPELRVLIIGASISEPETRIELEQAAKELGIEEQVIFTGRSMDVPYILSALDVSVLPSLSEGLSNTILESMAAGVPVVATSVGGNRELIKDKETGLLVNARDGVGLAFSILRLIKEPALAARLAASARETVRHGYTNAQMVNAMESLYERLVAAKYEQRARSAFSRRTKEDPVLLRDSARRL